MTSDALALLLGFVAVSIGMKVATSSNPFGFKRFETIAAFVNGLTLIVIPLLVIAEAIKRFVHPVDVLSKEMMTVGIIGLVVNLIVAFILSRGNKDNLNVKAAFLHVLSDLFTSVTVIISSIIIMKFGWTIVDPIVSIVSSLVILRGGFAITKESYHILMEGFPRHLSESKIRKQLEELPFVQTIESLHIWSISGEDAYAMLKLHTTPQYSLEEVKKVFEGLGISSTIEIQPAGDEERLKNN